MAQRWVAEELIAQARKASGLERFDSDSFREGLDVFLADANKSPPVEAARERFTASIVTALADRLKVTDYLDKRPELLQRPVERPVFVFGVPRTGTTLLSNLLAADPARRSPLTWEIDDPVPPPASATLYNDPRALARLEIEAEDAGREPGDGQVLPQFGDLSQRVHVLHAARFQGADLGIARQVPRLPRLAVPGGPGARPTRITSASCNCCRRTLRASGT